MDADHAFKKLICGNLRFVNERYANIDIGVTRRLALANQQYPFAVIVGCSDSRVPPEIVFDQGLGDLFVVRTAGNVVDNIALGSIEYAIKVLGVRLIVVMGHQDCGAVKAAVDGEPVPGQIALISKSIQPAVQIARMQQGNILANAIRNNVYLTIDKLLTSPILQQAIQWRGLEIAGAVYHLRDGRVVFF